MSFLLIVNNKKCKIVHKSYCKNYIYDLLNTFWCLIIIIITFNSILHRQILHFYIKMKLSEAYLCL